MTNPSDISLAGVSLDGTDIMFCLTEAAMRQQIAALYANGFISGNVKDDEGRWSILSIDLGDAGALSGTLEQPEVSFAAKGRPNQIKMTFRLTRGKLTSYVLNPSFSRSKYKLDDSATWPFVPVEGTFDELRYVFYVDLDIAAIHQDSYKAITAREAENESRRATGQAPLPVPSMPGVVRKLFERPEAQDFTPMSLFVDFENCDLANYEPTECAIVGWSEPDDPLGSSISRQTLQGLLKDHFTSLKGTDNPYVLGYGMQGGDAAPKGAPPVLPPAPPPPGPWVPNSASFSVYDNASSNDLNTLNILLWTENRTAVPNTGLLQAPLVTGLSHTGVAAISAELLAAQLVDPILLGIARAYHCYLNSLGANEISGYGHPFQKLADTAQVWGTSLRNGQWKQVIYHTVGLTWDITLSLSDRRAIGTDSGMADIDLVYTQSMSASVRLANRDAGGVELSGEGSIAFTGATKDPVIVGDASSLKASKGFTFSIVLQLASDGSGNIIAEQTFTPGETSKDTDTDGFVAFTETFGGDISDWTSRLDDSVASLEGVASAAVGATVASALSQVKNRAALPFGEAFHFTGLWVDTIGNLVSSLDWTQPQGG